MPLLTPPPSRPQRGIKATFKGQVDAFIAWMIDTFYTQLLALVAGLNSLAMGSAYAIPFSFDNGTVAGDPGAGEIRLNNAVLANVTAIYVSTTSEAGKAITAWLDSMMASTSTVKGKIKLISQSDPTKYLVLNVTAEDTSHPTYRVFTVSYVDSTSPVWLADDILLLSFTPTGDKGDTGATGAQFVYPTLRVRDEKPTASGPGAYTATTWNTRTLNTVKKNTIGAGASLALNQITLPAGTYKVVGSAPAALCNGHQAVLYSVTDAAFLINGVNAYASTSAGSVITYSKIEGEIVLAATKVLELRHFLSAAGGSPGFLVNSGQVEVYSEIVFEKVA